MNPQLPLTEELVNKTINEVRTNIAKRENRAFGNGILWCVVVTWLGMALVYAQGSTPNPGIMLGSLVYGLWLRFKKGR